MASTREKYVKTARRYHFPLRGDRLLQLAALGTRLHTGQESIDDMRENSCFDDAIAASFIGALVAVSPYTGRRHGVSLAAGRLRRACRHDFSRAFTPIKPCRHADAGRRVRGAASSATIASAPILKFAAVSFACRPRLLPWAIRWIGHEYRALTRHLPLATHCRLLSAPMAIPAASRRRFGHYCCFLFEYGRPLFLGAPIRLITSDSAAATSQAPPFHHHIGLRRGPHSSPPPCRFCDGTPPTCR